MTSYYFDIFKNSWYVFNYIYFFIIDDTSKKSVGATQNVSAATEEQSASVEEIAAASQDLAQLAESLRMSVSVFKIS